MKRTSIWLLAAMLLASVGCLKEEQAGEALNYRLNATVEEFIPETRAGFSDLQNGAKFFWTEGDAIAVGSGTYHKFTTNAKTGSPTATFSGTGKPVGYAVYPFGRVKGISGNELTYEYAREYNYKTVDTDFFNGMSVDLPMWAAVEGENVSFMHLGGVIAFKFPNLEHGNDQTFTVIADQKISGKYTVDLSTDTPQIAATETENGAEKIVIIKFSLNQAQDAVFYVPIPVGTYSLKAVLKNGDKEFEMEVGGLEVVRKGIRYTTVTTHTLQGSTEGTVSDESQVKEAMESSTDVVLTGVDGIDSTIEMPKKAENTEVEHTLTISSIANNTDVLTITEETESEDGENSIEKFTVEIPENYLKSLVIDMPETSVTLLPNGNTVSLNEVIATTAENTLNVGANLKIGKIIVNKGKVHLKAGAKVNEIVRGEGNTDVVKVTFEGNLPSNITFGENVVVCNENGEMLALDTATAQAALDNAAAGTTIKLQPGVSYGTLVFRQSASSRVVDITDAGGDAPGNEKYRRIENLTIMGAEGAVVDGIDFQVGWVNGSGASYIDVKDLTVQGVTFSGKMTAFNFEGGKGSALGIDGLKIIECKMTDDDSKDRLVFQQISGYKDLNDKATNQYVMTTGIKNLTISRCEVTNAYMVIESRAMNNLSITDNTFKGITSRDMLITSDTSNNPNVTYTGQIIITGNKSIAGEERFIRGSLNNSDAVVLIANNTIIDYRGEDADYIKVEGGTNVTIENNTCIVYSEAGLKPIAKVGGNYVLANDIELSNSIAISNANFILDGDGHTITMAEGATNNIALFDITGGNATIQNVTYDGIKGGAVVRTVGTVFNADNVTVKNCQHTVAQGLFRLMGESTITNCTFKENSCTIGITYNFDADTGNAALNEAFSLDNCVFENNTCSTIGVVYYAGGSAANINGNKFLNNKVNTSNGATLYMGFKTNCTITNNIFDSNAVTATSKRSSGGLMIGNAAVITGNCFVNNTVTVNGETGYGNDVCASVYYSDIDLSGNYWGGHAPVLNDDYYQEYDNYQVIINDHLTEYAGY